jgi:hypothetical protein
VPASGSIVLDLLSINRSTRLFCHPKDAENSIYPHHLSKAAQLQATQPVLFSTSRQLFRNELT